MSRKMLKIDQKFKVKYSKAKAKGIKLCILYQKDKQYFIDKRYYPKQVLWLIY